MTVDANKRSVIAKDAMNKCPGLCSVELPTMHTRMKIFPLMANVVIRLSTVKMNHFSGLCSAKASNIVVLFMIGQLGLSSVEKLREEDSRPL